LEESEARIVALISQSFREPWAAENACKQLREINTSFQHSEFQQARTRVANLRKDIRGVFQNAMQSNREKVTADLMAALDDLDDHIDPDSPYEPRKNHLSNTRTTIPRRLVADDARRAARP
jgi:molecular chaperone GrpE (heat shock protein)